jgi:hypothetical protein
MLDGANDGLQGRLRVPANGKLGAGAVDAQSHLYRLQHHGHHQRRSTVLPRDAHPLVRVLQCRRRPTPRLTASARQQILSADPPQ